MLPVYLSAHHISRFNNSGAGGGALPPGSWMRFFTIGAQLVFWCTIYLKREFSQLSGVGYTAPPGYIG
jgi:hypothetical protein